MLKSEFVTLKDKQWLDRQRIAGKAVASSLKSFANFVKTEKGMSLKDIEAMSLSILTSFDCTPTFHNYHGFPGKVCLSVNEQVVHGIPTDYVLQDGDIVTLDLGATFEGAIADADFTCIHGTAKKQSHADMVVACYNALNKGIEAVAIDKRIGAIGAAISRFAQSTPFGLIVDYGGHGLNYNEPHAAPFVANRSNDNEGIRIKPGLTIAIEPMLVLGGNTSLKKLEDGWTLVSPTMGCHTEHTIFVHEDSIEIITDHQMNIMDYV